MRFRLGAWTDLDVHARLFDRTDATVNDAQNRLQPRICKCYNAVCIQDEKHILCKCQPFGAVRAKYTMLFEDASDHSCKRLLSHSNH